MCVVYDRLSCKMKHIAFDFFLQLEFRGGGGVITSFRYTCIFMCVMCVSQPFRTSDGESKHNILYCNSRVDLILQTVGRYE